MPPLAIMAGIGIAGSIGGAAIQSHAAGKAADTQSQAAMYAADLQKKSADESLAFQKETWNTQQQNLAPWLSAGKNALTELQGIGDFQAPTSVTMQNDPGYQFRLAEGQKALERSAAARGGVLSGGTAKALSRYGQDYASNEYGNVYNRAMGEYQNKWNRTASVAGVGQSAANTLGQQGSQVAGNVSNILMNSAQQQGNAFQNAAYARASGYINGANAWGGAFGNIGNTLMDAYMIQQQGNS